MSIKILVQFQLPEMTGIKVLDSDLTMKSQHDSLYIKVKVLKVEIVKGTCCVYINYLVFDMKSLYASKLFYQFSLSILGDKSIFI